MPRKKSPSSDSSSARSERLRAQSKDELVALLDELAGKHPEVEARLARHALAADPAALAAQFRHHLQSWKRSARFRPRSAAAAFGRELESFLDEIERELLPLDAGRAHALADAFVRMDERLFEQADDSDGVIGDAVRAGCRLWLITAKARADRLPAQWIDRVYALVNADEYGTREALLRHADLLLAPPDLRALAGRFEDDLERALARRAGDQAGHPVFKAAAAVGLVADALRDPDLSTRTTLRYSPVPNPLQKEQFVERYLRFGRPAEALVWLDGDWGMHEERRERLLAQAYAALNDAVELRAVRRQLFDRTGSASDFEAWRGSLAPAERSAAAAVARERAQNHDDPITGAQLLLALDDDAAAEALLVARHANLRGEEYHRLVPLAQTMEEKGRLLGAVACYRALLTAILARAYARAYGHAAEYLAALRQLDLRVHGYGALPTHEAFEAALRNMHGRKVAFWSRLRA
ncbi:MAG TPA: hypothetical protein VFZ14_19475 [Burkholderiales bacterium]|nr:hypothetical protein [Burkholderiales bacterium]